MILANVTRRAGEPRASAREIVTGAFSNPKHLDELRILKAMGRETANVHYDTKSAIADIRSDLKHRSAEWLNDAAGRMTDATLEEWKIWRKAQAG